MQSDWAVDNSDRMDSFSSCDFRAERGDIWAERFFITFVFDFEEVSRADYLRVPRKRLDREYLEGILFLVAAHFGLTSVIRYSLWNKLEFRFGDRVVTYDMASFSKLFLLCAFQLLTNIGPFYVCGTSIFGDNVDSKAIRREVWICLLTTWKEGGV